MVNVVVVTAVMRVIVLAKAGKALSAGALEARVKAEAKGKNANTFDIRDAVSELVAAGKVEFDQPGYKVKLRESLVSSTETTPAAKSQSSGKLAL
jgi:hypothetical protein